jgi:hypothetical protein
LGRTNPTYRDTLGTLETRWADFRRALRYDDQRRFDRLFEHARAHADAASYLNHQLVELPLILSIAVEQQKQIDALEERVDRLEARLDPSEAGR